MHADDMDALLTRTEGRLLRAWLAMLAHLRDENSIEVIQSKLAVGHYETVVGLESAATRFAAEVHAAYVASGQAAAKWLNGQFRKSATSDGRTTVLVEKKLAVFDAVDPVSVQWAERNRLELRGEVSNEQRDAIREILVAGARSGVNPRDMARQIRDSIGLTAHQAGIVENYRRELVEGQYGAALARELSDGRHDRTIRAVQASGGRLTPAQIDTMTERYRANWVALRSETIARTEGLRVAHQGSEELYRQAIANGDIEADQIQRTWNHSPGAKNKKNERAFHRSMHGQVRAYGEAFRSGLGNELRFPGDPDAPLEEIANCRCAVSTRIVATTRTKPALHSVPPDREFADALARTQERAAERAAQRQAAAEAEREAARQAAAIEQLAATVEAEPAGFRIGVTSEITGETQADEVAWLDEQRAAQETRVTPIAPVEPTGDPYRTPAAGPETVPSSKPAPLGFEAIDHVDGQTYYRARSTGRAYTADQMAAREKPSYAIELTGPNVQTAGYETLEIKTPSMPTGEIRYRSVASGATYTPEMLASGEAAAHEEFLAHPPEVKKPGFLGRLFGRLAGSDRGR